MMELSGLIAKVEEGVPSPQNLHIKQEGRPRKHLQEWDEAWGIHLRLEIAVRDALNALDSYVEREVS
jgi:hypothetical protein